MKNKMKYLQAVLHEPAPEPVPNENPSTEVQGMFPPLSKFVHTSIILCLYLEYFIGIVSNSVFQNVLLCEQHVVLLFLYPANFY